MLSSTLLPKKHNCETMPGDMRLFCCPICLGVVLLFYLLYFTEMLSNGPPLSAVVSPKQVPGHPFGNGINKLNNNDEFNSSINTIKGQNNSPNNVDENRRETEKSLISRRLQDFRHEWLRQRRARVDWKNIIKPCADNMAWGLVKDYWGKTNRSNATTSDIIFKDVRPAGEFSKIFIQSKTSDNRTKLIGGDTWRVYVRGPTSIAATVFDHNNGIYEALFLITEPGVYQLMIYLDYSLCDGFKDPPRDWFIIGDAQGTHHRDGVLGPLDEYLVKQPFKNGQRALTINVTKAQLKVDLSGETIRASFELITRRVSVLIDEVHFAEMSERYYTPYKLEDLVSCSETCKYLWDGFGQWKNDQWMPHLKESYKWSMPQNYEQSGTLWIYGDSVGYLLNRSVQARPLCKSLYQKCGNSYMWIYPAHNKGLNITMERDLDFRPEKVIATIVDVLRTPEMQQEESALLLNLVLHFAKTVNFTTYQKLIDDLILVLKAKELSQGERVPKYKAKIIWKSSTAICKEKASSLKRTDFRFLTTQRVALFSAYSMSAMCKAGFDVIDVYPLTDSYPLRCMDHVHYRNKVFKIMETMLEQYKIHYNQKLDENEKQGKIKRCISKENF